MNHKQELCNADIFTDAMLIFALLFIHAPRPEVPEVCRQTASNAVELATGLRMPQVMPFVNLCLPGQTTNL